MAKSKYSDLPKLIGYLKRAAIDAYMMHNEELRYVIEGSEYVSINSGAVKYRVSRPGVDGTGGGDWNSELFISQWILDGERDEYFSDLFDSIRNTIDEILKPWKSLPDPDDFEPHMDIVRDISSRLAASSEVRNSAIIGAGDIAYRIVLINNNLSSMSGATIGAFKDNYLGRLSGVVGGLHNVAMLWGASLGSEKAIFEDARKKVVTVIEQATESFKSVAKESASQRNGGFSIALAATLAAGKGLAYLTSGTGLTVFGDGILTFLKESAGDDAKEKDLKTYNSVLSSFKSMLKKLNDNITDGEEAIQDNFRANIKRVHAQRHAYDLAFVPFRSSDIDTKSEATIYSKQLVDEIVDQYLPRIVEEVVKTRKLIGGVSMMKPATRDRGIGIDAHGPFGSFSDWGTILEKMLQDLEWELTNGTRDFKLAIEAIVNADASSKANLDSFTDSLGGKSGVKW